MYIYFQRLPPTSWTWCFYESNVKQCCCGPQPELRSKAGRKLLSSCVKVTKKKSLPGSGRGCKVTVATDQMFRKSLQADKKEAASTAGQPERGHFQEDKLQHFFTSARAMAFEQLPSTFSSLFQRQIGTGARKSHLSRKRQLRREHFRGNAFPQPPLSVQKKGIYFDYLMN